MTLLPHCSPWVKHRTQLLLLLLWMTVLTSSTNPTGSVSLEAHSGSEVVLTCSAPPGTDLEDVVLEWTRSDLERDYMFLYRDGRPYLVYQHPRFRSRVELKDPTLQSGDLSITLRGLTKQDSGRYECHVVGHSHVRKRSLYNTKPIRTIDLTVRDPGAERGGGETDELQILRAEVEVMRAQLMMLQTKRKSNILDLESRSRRPNLRLVGVPEGEEGDDTESSLEKMVPELISGSGIEDRKSTSPGPTKTSNLCEGTCHGGCKRDLQYKETSSTKGPPVQRDLQYKEPPKAPEPETIQAFPGKDVVLPIPPVNFAVTSVMLKRADDPEQFVFLHGMGHPHHQNPQYDGRVHFKSQDQTEVQDLSLILRDVQPSDNGTYHFHIMQSAHRMKRDVSSAEPDRVIILEVASGGVTFKAGVGFVAAAFLSVMLQI